MSYGDRLREIDALLATPHRVLNSIAVGKAVDTAEVFAAVAEITKARDLLVDGAEPAPNN